MNDKERAFIIIDGNNFYHRLKELNLTNLLSFDYEKFTQFLVGRRELVSKNYYIGAYENLYDSVILVTSDTDLIPALAKASGFRLRLDEVEPSARRSPPEIEEV